MLVLASWLVIWLTPLLRAKHVRHDGHEGGPDRARRLDDVLAPVLGDHGDRVVEQGGSFDDLQGGICLQAAGRMKTRDSCLAGQVHLLLHLQPGFELGDLCLTVRLRARRGLDELGAQ